MGTKRDQEVLVTVAEAVKHLGVSRATIFRLCRQGILERRVVNGRQRSLITLASILNYRGSSKVTIQKLAARVLALEAKVNRILSGNTSISLPPTDTTDSKLSEILAKNHPKLFNSKA